MQLFTILSQDEDGDPITYEIDWQDGSKYQATRGSGLPVEIAHTWNRAGTYQISVSASDKTGAKTRTIYTLVVR